MHEANWSVYFLSCRLIRQLTSFQLCGQFQCKRRIAAMLTWRVRVSLTLAWHENTRAKYIFKLIHETDHFRIQRNFSSEMKDPALIISFIFEFILPGNFVWKTFFAHIILYIYIYIQQQHLPFKFYWIRFNEWLAIRCRNITFSTRVWFVCRVNGFCYVRERKHIAITLNSGAKQQFSIRSPTNPSLR